MANYWKLKTRWVFEALNLKTRQEKNVTILESVLRPLKTPENAPLHEPKGGGGGGGLECASSLKRNMKKTYCSQAALQVVLHQSQVSLVLLSHLCPHRDSFFTKQALQHAKVWETGGMLKNETCSSTERFCWVLSFSISPISFFSSTLESLEAITKMHRRKTSILDYLGEVVNYLEWYCHML